MYDTGARTHAHTHARTHAALAHHDGLISLATKLILKDNDLLSGMAPIICYGRQATVSVRTPRTATDEPRLGEGRTHREGVFRR